MAGGRDVVGSKRAARRRGQPDSEDKRDSEDKPDSEDKRDGEDGRRRGKRGEREKSTDRARVSAGHGLAVVNQGG
ncbi:hypothetical protein GCM10009828_105070 [Actinoplanes couchii]|uniref:Uncharacterized protein n=1 Tax=Actinoplanes couchii TaxID=403638 RepID=A0ABQ3XFX8_9ACTN|nr:hypothetical protein Aco03nite_058040 [Actinoplanes couchii]